MAREIPTYIAFTRGGREHGRQHMAAAVVTAVLLLLAVVLLAAVALAWGSSGGRGRGMAAAAALCGAGALLIVPDTPAGPVGAWGGAAPKRPAAQRAAHPAADLAGLYGEYLRAVQLLSRVQDAAGPCEQVRPALETWLRRNRTVCERRDGIPFLVKRIARGCSRGGVPADRELLAKAIEPFFEDGPPAPSPAPVLKEDGGRLTYGEYSLTKTPRVTALLAVGGGAAVVAAGLKYGSILAAKGAYYRTLPPAAYRVLWEAGVRNEAFATPFTALALNRGLDGEYWSLFPETDRAFGSQGRFLDAPDLAAFSGGWWIRPPPLGVELAAAVERALALSAGADVVFAARPDRPPRPDRPRTGTGGSFEPEATTLVGGGPGRPRTVRLKEPKQTEGHLAKLAKAAAASVLVAKGDHAWVDAGIGGEEGELAASPTDTQLFYLGAKPAREAEKLLKAVAAQWKRAAASAAAPATSESSAASDSSASEL